MPVPPHPIPWDVSHGIPIAMTFPWTSLQIWRHMKALASHAWPGQFFKTIQVKLISFGIITVFHHSKVGFI